MLGRIFQAHPMYSTEVCLGQSLEEVKGNFNGFSLPDFFDCRMNLLIYKLHKKYLPACQ